MTLFCGLMPLSAQQDYLQDLQWEVEMQQYNEEVQARQQKIDAEGYTPSAGLKDIPDRYTWLLVPCMGYQWNREGGAGEFENGKEGTLSAGDMLNCSWGLMVGAVKQYGGYVRYRYGETEDPWIDMTSHQFRAGGLFRTEEQVCLYAGLGVEFYKMVNSYTKKEAQPGRPWQNITEKDNWAAVEAGIMGRWGRFVVSGGMSYSFSKGTFDGSDSGADIGFDIGIGIAL